MIFVQMKEQDLIKLFLPEGILDYFTVTEIKKEFENYFISLEENNIPPEQYKDTKLVAHGFHNTATIQDFPLRGKPCFLLVKRRRWIIEKTGKVVSRDWNLVAHGTRITQEFALFLKGINR